MTKRGKRQLFAATFAVGMVCSILTVSILGSILGMPIWAMVAVAIYLSFAVAAGAIIGIRMFSRYPPRFAEPAPPKRVARDEKGPDSGLGKTPPRGN